MKIIALSLYRFIAVGASERLAFEVLQSMVQPKDVSGRVELAIIHDGAGRGGHDCFNQIELPRFLKPSPSNSQANSPTLPEGG